VSHVQPGLHQRPGHADRGGGDHHVDADGRDHGGRRTGPIAVDDRLQRREATAGRSRRPAGRRSAAKRGNKLLLIIIGKNK